MVGFPSVESEPGGFPARPPTVLNRGWFAEIANAVTNAMSAKKNPTIPMGVLFQEATEDIIFKTYQFNFPKFLDARPIFRPTYSIVPEASRRIPETPSSDSSSTNHSKNATERIC